MNSDDNFGNDDLRSDPDQDQQPVKTKRSLYKKGQSGNPGGRPKDVFGLAELARSHGPEVVDTLLSIMRNRKVQAQARVRACVELLDRGYGRAMQELRIDADVAVARAPVSSIELARRIWHLLNGGHELPDPSKAIDPLALASPATPEAVPATLEHEPAPTPMPQPAPSIGAQDDPLGEDEEEF